MVNQELGVYTDEDSGTNTSGVSWGAIFAGAAAAAALSLILLILGFGLGFSAMSPWAYKGASAKSLGISSIVWLAFTQIAASGLGGYLAGRLRVKWVNVHDDEVYFRDTAHGFLAWAVASLVTAAFLASAAGAVAEGGARAGASAATAAATAGTGLAAAAINRNGNTDGNANGNSVGYFVDTLFRADQPAASTSSTTPAVAVPDANSDAATRLEAAKIFGNDLRYGSLSADDQHYLGQLIAKRTGLSQQDAEKRASDAFAKVSKTIADDKAAAWQAADKARKAAAYSALWMFVALLCGAFFASLAATYGGRQRDFVVGSLARRGNI